MKNQLFYNMEQLNELIVKKEEELRWIIQDKNKDKEMLLNALKYVKNFIIDRKLIIYGGVAIDRALRLKGTYIYDEREIPDYDCYSSNSVEDAYDLGEILNSAGFENVKVIRAKNIETMRVRINLVTVADIKYIPLIYFNQYKFLIFDQLRISHPDIQKMDIHKAFCFPFNNAPMEDIFHRWEKDLYKFNIYDKYYPLKISKITYNNTTYKFKLPDIDYIFHGFTAFALYYNTLHKLKDISHIPNLNIIIDKNILSIDLPTNNYIHLVTSDDIAVTNSTVLNFIPEYLFQDDIFIYKVNMLSIVNIEDKKVVNIQYLLLWFLFNYNFDKDEHNKTIYKNFYVYTMEMITLSQSLLNKSNNPFNPSIMLSNTTEYFIPKINPLLPINYTPSKINTRPPTFNYDVFKLSGENI